MILDLVIAGKVAGFGRSSDTQVLCPRTLSRPFSRDVENNADEFDLNDLVDILLRGQSDVHVSRGLKSACIIYAAEIYLRLSLAYHKR